MARGAPEEGWDDLIAQTYCDCVLYSCSYVYKPLQFFKVIGIPGPKPKPVIGNLDLVGKYNVSLVTEVLDSSPYLIFWFM